MSVLLYGGKSLLDANQRNLRKTLIVSRDRAFGSESRLWVCFSRICQNGTNMLRMEVCKREAGFFIPRLAILLSSNAAEG
jgi:hypothetical protein